MTTQNRHERRKLKRKQRSKSNPTSSLSREQLHKRNMAIQFKQPKKKKELMKAIAWLNTCLILGENTLLTIRPDGVSVQNTEVNFVINFTEDPNIVARMNDDEMFKASISNLAGAVLMNFLNSDLTVCILAQQILSVKIEQPKEAAQSNNGAVPPPEPPTETPKETVPEAKDAN